MFIVRFCTIHLVVFSGFLTYTYAMVDRSDKHPQVSSRQDRQLGPVLNSIVFLIAANLVAKGALGLGAYQAPPLPGNIQGSLFLSLNAPQGIQQTQAQQYQQFPQLPQFPLGQQPKPVSQTQVINIGEPLYEEVEEYKDKGFERAFGNSYRYNTLEDPLEVAASNEVELTTPTTEIPSTTTTTTTTSVPTTTEISTTPEDVEILSESITSEEEEPMEIGRQATMNATTMRPAPTTSEGGMANTTMATTPMTISSTLATNMTNATQPSLVYGPPNEYPQLSLTYGPPGGNINATNTNRTTNATHPGYNYFPAGDYGPYTGNEKISITYGPPIEGPNYQPIYQRPEFLRPEYQTPNLRPIYQRPEYQKPFLSSPEDPFLNRYNEFQNNYDGFYNSPSYMNTFKYSDFYKSFYNKFDYNYPSLYNNNNYLGKK